MFLSIFSATREETIAARLTKALAARETAAQAVREVDAALQAVHVDPETDDPETAMRHALDERQRLQRQRAERLEALELATALVDNLEQVAFQAHMQQRQREAVQVLQLQADCETKMELAAARLKAIDLERVHLDEQLRESRTQLNGLVSRLRDLQRGGVVRQLVSFTVRTRDEVPARHPMRVSEWCRLWDGAHVALGLNALDVMVDRTTGRIVGFAPSMEVPGFEVVDRGDYCEVVR